MPIFVNKKNQIKMFVINFVSNINGFELYQAVNTLKKEVYFIDQPTSFGSYFRIDNIEKVEELYKKGYFKTTFEEKIQIEGVQYCPYTRMELLKLSNPDEVRPNFIFDDNTIQHWYDAGCPNPWIFNPPVIL